MPDIQVDVRYAGNDNDVAIISAKGFIDTTTAPDLEKKLEEQLALNKYKIIVDLKNIDYVSSAGWGVFVSEIREIRENNGDLVLINMSSDVYDVYELMEFSSILKSFDNIEDAIANFTGELVSRPAAKPVQPKITAPVKPAPEKAEQKVQPKPAPQARSVKSEDDIYSLAKTELGKRILNVIIDNPYFELREIIKALKLPQYGGAKASGGSVKKELKGMDLFDRQKRFELALKRKK